MTPSHDNDESKPYQRRKSDPNLLPMSDFDRLCVAIGDVKVELLGALKEVRRELVAMRDDHAEDSQALAVMKFKIEQMTEDAADTDKEVEKVKESIDKGSPLMQTLLQALIFAVTAGVVAFIYKLVIANPITP